MKKIVFGCFTVVALLSIAGCNKQSAKDEYAAFQEKQSNGTFNQSSFEMKLEDLSVSGSENAAAITMIANQFKDVTISGDSLVNAKEEAMSAHVTVDFMGERVPVEVIFSKGDLYLSSNVVSGITDVAKAYGLPVTVDQTVLDGLKDKYVKFTKEELEKNYGTATGSSVDMASLFESKDNQTFVEFIKTLDEDSFKKEKDTITHTFTKEEIDQYVAYAKKNGSKEVKEALKQYESLANLEQLQKLDIMTKLDTKKNQLTMTVEVAVKEQDQTATVKLKMTNQLKESKDTVTVPAKDTLISQEELTQAVEKLYSDNAALTGAGAE